MIRSEQTLHFTQTDKVKIAFDNLDVPLEDLLVHIKPIEFYLQLVGIHKLDIISVPYLFSEGKEVNDTTVIEIIPARFVDGNAQWSNLRVKLSERHLRSSLGCSENCSEAESAKKIDTELKKLLLTLNYENFVHTIQPTHFIPFLIYCFLYGHALKHLSSQELIFWIIIRCALVGIQSYQANKEVGAPGNRISLFPSIPLDRFLIGYLYLLSQPLVSQINPRGEEKS